MSPGHAGPYHQVVKRLMARVAILPPRVQDLALALALTIFDVAAVLPYQSQLHPFGLAVALVIAQSVPLIWRRSWPVPVHDRRQISGTVVAGARPARVRCRTHHL